MPTFADVPPALAGQRLDAALARLFPDRSRTFLGKMANAGLVRVEGRQEARASLKMAGGERLSLFFPDREDKDSPEQMPLDILYEDESLLVVNKPASLVVHPGAGNPRGTLVNALLFHCPQMAALPRAGLVHRLDKDTTGLLVAAKTFQAHKCLVDALAKRAIKRQYLALAWGHPPLAGTVHAPVGRDGRCRTKMAVNARGKPACTHFRTLASFPAASLLHLCLETGRTHQIRVHLEHLGYPVVGDPLYRKGAKAGIPFPRQALHAWGLGFLHPESGKPLFFSAPPPEDFLLLLKTLDNDHALDPAGFLACPPAHPGLFDDPPGGSKPRAVSRL